MTDCNRCVAVARLSERVNKWDRRWHERHCQGAQASTVGCWRTRPDDCRSCREPL